MWKHAIQQINKREKKKKNQLQNKANINTTNHDNKPKKVKINS